MVEAPDAAGLSMPRFNGPHGGLERGHVDGVAGEDFVSQREALGGDHQGDVQLLAVGAVVARVAAPGFGHRFGGALEVGARQVVEDDVEVGAEQVIPHGGQVGLKGLLVFDDVVQATVEAAQFGHVRAAVQQDAHGGPRKPLFVDI